MPERALPGWETGDREREEPSFMKWDKWGNAIQPPLYMGNKHLLEQGIKSNELSPSFSPSPFTFSSSNRLSLPPQESAALLGSHFYCISLTSCSLSGSKTWLLHAVASSPAVPMGSSASPRHHLQCSCRHFAAGPKTRGRNYIARFFHPRWSWQHLLPCSCNPLSGPH